MLQVIEPVLRSSSDPSPARNRLARGLEAERDLAEQLLVLRGVPPKLPDPFRDFSKQLPVLRGVSPEVSNVSVISLNTCSSRPMPSRTSP